MKTIDSMLISKNLGGIGKSSSEHLILQLMKLRNRKGITQNQLAKQIDVSHTTIARIENFSMQPTLKMLTQILDVYGMTLEIVPKKNYGISELENATEEISINKSKLSSKNLIEIISIFCKETTLYVDSKEDYINFIDDILTKYLEIMTLFNVDDYILCRVNRFNKYINIILSEYCCGRHNLAYDILKEALLACIDIEVFMKDMSNNCVLYRGRKKKKKRYTKQEMFHIPFESRYIVSTQRYSFPGLPCLYLGSSSDVCVTELNENVSDLAIARLIYHEKQQKNKILDLTGLFFDYFSGAYETCIEKFLINLPLVLVCSTYINYKKEDAVKFKKEYIIPQLLLEYIINESILKDNKVIGIKYFSVKEDFLNCFSKGDFYTMQKICNYVFPTIDAKNRNGYCTQLSNLFEVVEITEQK